MKSYTVRKYQSSDYSLWNEFVANAKNATFLFHRDFMEYHSDRFEDFSLLIFDPKDSLIAILPANRVEDVLYSHQGLTYGGLVVQERIDLIQLEIVFNCLRIYLKENDIKNATFKIIPSIYHRIKSFEFDLILHKNASIIENREMSLVIDFSQELKISKSKLRHFKKSNPELEIREEDDMEPFWNNVLIPRLQEKYNSTPVHSLEEINQLKGKFKTNIVQFSAYHNKKIVAGLTLFITEDVVKSQYGATTKEGEKLRALDFLFITLIKRYKFEGKKYFDMGTVHNNPGLLNQKIELGCSIYLLDNHLIAI